MENSFLIPKERNDFFMRITTFDMDEFVKINNLKEVTSPVLFERGGVPLQTD